MNYNYTCPTNLKDGLSGFMKVKNEENFVGDCIDSIIESLDELIIVYNDCTDATPEILEQKLKQYPDKIRIYPYNHDVLAFRLSKSEYEVARNFPNDSKRLFCNQCNYALSQVRYKYAMVVDADQYYFSNVILHWRNVCARPEKIRWNIKCFLGGLLAIYMSIYRKCSLFLNRSLHGVFPKKSKYLYECYEKFAMLSLIRGTGCISLSGLNVFKDGDWYVPFDRFNVNPPYNGEGDHLIFRVSPNTFFSKYCYLKQGYSVVEKFNHSYRLLFGGLAWFHLHANRPHNWSKVKSVKDKYPDAFMKIEDFVKMSSHELHAKIKGDLYTTYQRAIFHIVHKLGLGNVLQNIHLLK